MKKLLYKELRLAASPLSYIFILFAFLCFLPGYPILVSAFFVTLGIFYSFGAMRENNDIHYSLLLPISKSDIVKSKFAFTVFIEGCAFAIMSIITIVRMIFLKDVKIYTSNAMMNANLCFLGFVLLIFGAFNFFFVRGFFKTAYYFGKPFISYAIIGFLIIAIAETLHHLPGAEKLNTPGYDNLPLQCAFFALGALTFALLSVSALSLSRRSFDKIDL